MTVVDWALTRDLSAPKKLLLVALAWISDDLGVTFKSQKVIAARLGKDTRWLREHLPGLAAEGHVTRYRRHRANGSRTSDLLVINWPRPEPLDLDAYSGIVGEPEPGDHVPSGENPPGGLPAGNGRPSGEEPPIQSQPLDEPVGDKKKRVREDAFPDDLPPELFEVAVAAGKILKRVAVERGQAKAVTRLTVGHAVLTYPDRDHVLVAREVEAWMLHGRGAQRSCRDVVARYRNFLSNAEPRPGPPLPGGAGARRPNAPSSGPGTLRAMAEELRNGAE